MPSSYPPGPPPMRVFGAWGSRMAFQRDPIAYHARVYQQYGTLAAQVQGRPKLLVYDPSYVRQILTQPDVFHATRVAMPGPSTSSLHRLGMGLNTLNGDSHRTMRRLVLPAFHKQHVDSYVTAMVRTCDHILASWGTGGVRDMAMAMAEMTLQITTTTLFALDGTDDVSVLGKLMAAWIHDLASPLAHLLPSDLPGTPYRRLLQRSNAVEAAIRTLITRKRTTQARQRDVLSLLLDAYDEATRNRLTDDELIAQSTLLFLAGFETSAVALTWTLFLLSQHPDVLRDVMDEVRGVLEGAPPTIAQINAFPLLERVIKESLRLLPPAIQGGRTSVEDFAFGPYTFPAGTKVMYSQYITHRLPEIYPEPQRFLPGRWETLNPSPYAYFPFLAGPRMCLGSVFAMLEMKVVLAMLFNRFNVCMAPHTTVNRAVVFTLVPQGGLPMKILPPTTLPTRELVGGNIHEMVSLERYETRVRR